MSTSTAATTAPTISFTIKSAQGERIEISDEPIQTKIKSLKETISERLGGTKSEAELLRLIYKGHVLKDEKTIEESQIGDGHAVHLVKSAPKQMQSNDNTNSSTTMTSRSRRGDRKMFKKLWHGYFDSPVILLQLFNRDRVRASSDCDELCD